MRITTLGALSAVLFSIAACNNDKPAEPAATAPAAETSTVPDVTVPTNEVTATIETTNAVVDPAPANGVGMSKDDPRGLPDRRTETPSDATTEAK